VKNRHGELGKVKEEIRWTVIDYGFEGGGRC
jgi:hypothetical protein